MVDDACRVAKHHEIEESGPAAYQIRCGAGLLTPSGGSPDPSWRVDLGKAMKCNTRVKGHLVLAAVAAASAVISSIESAGSGMPTPSPADVNFLAGLIRT